MSHFNGNKNRADIEGLAASDIREMQRQLKLGHAEAQMAAKQRRGELEGPVNLTTNFIEAMGKRAEESLQKLRKELGRLNLMLSLEAMENDDLIDDFRERFGERFGDQVARTRKTLARLEDKSRESLAECDNGLEGAWRSFTQRLEIVSAQLKVTKQFTEQELERERQRVRRSLS